MRVDLLKHNQEAYEKVQKAIKEGFMILKEISL